MIHSLAGGEVKDIRYCDFAKVQILEGVHTGDIFWYITEVADLKAQDKVIHICKMLGGTQYINAIGGQELYSFDDFKKNGLELSFLKTEFTPYKQFKNDFIPGLSMIDILMFNSPEQIKTMLNAYSLIKGK